MENSNLKEKEGNLDLMLQTLSSEKNKLNSEINKMTLEPVLDSAEPGGAATRHARVCGSSHDVDGRRGCDGEGGGRGARREGAEEERSVSHIFPTCSIPKQ